jgi:hypothetical protein
MSSGWEATVTRVSGLQRRAAAEPAPRQPPLSKVLADAADRDEDGEGEEEEAGGDGSSSDPTLDARKERPRGAYLFVVVCVACASALVGGVFLMPRVRVAGYELWRAILLLNVAVFSFGAFTLLVRGTAFVVGRLTYGGRSHYLMHNLRVPIRNVFWSTTCYATWRGLFRDVRADRPGVRPRVDAVVTSIQITIVVLAVQSILVRLPANKFHAGTYFDRIRRSVANQLVVERLSVPYHSLPDVRPSEEDLEASLRRKRGERQTIMPPNVSFNALLSIARKRRKMPECADEASARLFAQDVFANVVPDSSVEVFDRTHLTRFFVGCEGQIDEFMDACFDGADEVRLQTFQDFIVRLNEEIVLLKLALTDKRSAIASISTATRAVCLAACAFVACIIVFRLDLTKVMVLASSWLVSSILIVGPAIRDVVDGVVFVFVRHPYDMGDFVEIDKEVYLVDSVGLLSTIFLYKRRITSIPNKGLAGGVIVNLSRTTFTEVFSVLVKRPIHVEDAVAAFLRARKTLWEPDTFSVVFANGEHCPCVRLTVVVNCKYPFENRTRNSNELFEFLYRTVGERCECSRSWPSSS